MAAPDEASSSLILAPRPSLIREGAAVSAAFVLIDLVFLYWIWAQFPNWGIWDWDFMEVLLEAARTSVVDHGQLPLWNPFLGGGFTLVGHPEVRAFNPSFIIVLAFGTIPGIKLCIFLYMLVAQWGMFRLARHEHLSRTAAFLAAIVFSLSGWYAQHIAHGHFTWIGFAWAPFVMLAIVRSEREGLRLRTIAIGGLCCGFAMLDGGPYAIGFLPLFLALYTLTLAARSRGADPIWAFGATMLVGALVAAVQLAPIAETILAYRRETPPLNNFYGAPFSKGAFEILYQGFVSREQAHDPALWMPYILNVGSYVGLLPVSLSAAALALRPRRVWPLAACFLVSVWIYLGASATPDLWSWIHRLPLFGSLQVPARFNVFMVLALALLAGHGLDGLRESLTRMMAKRGSREGVAARRLRWIVVGISLWVAADMSWVNGPVFKTAFSIPPVELREKGEFVQHLDSPYRKGWRARALHPTFPNWPNIGFASTLENTGVLRAWNNLGYAQNAIPRSSSRYRGEVYAREGDDLDIRRVVMTPNEIQIDVAGAGGSVVINQNFDAGWTLLEGKGSVEAHEGVIAIRVPPGDQEIRLAFRPGSFVLGATISALAILGVIVCLFASRGGPLRGEDES